MGTQTLGPEAAIEGLDEGVAHRLAWAGKGEDGAVHLGSGVIRHIE